MKLSPCTQIATLVALLFSTSSLSGQTLTLFQLPEGERTVMLVIKQPPSPVAEKGKQAAPGILDIWVAKTLVIENGTKGIELTLRDAILCQSGERSDPASQAVIPIGKTTMEIPASVEVMVNGQLVRLSNLKAFIEKHWRRDANARVKNDK